MINQTAPIKNRFVHMADHCAHDKSLGAYNDSFTANDDLPIAYHVPCCS